MKLRVVHFMSELFDTYIPNALFRIRVFFKPSIEKEVDSFINSIEKELIEHKKDLLNVKKEVQ